MAEQKKPDDFVEQLLRQDALPDDNRYARHREQLDQRLRKAVRDEKIMRMATVVVWVLPLAGLLLAQTLWPHSPPAGFVGDFLFPAVVLLQVVCGLLAIPMLAVYVLRYRHAVDRVRGEARDAKLMELQEAVAKLVARLPADGEPRARPGK